MELNLDSLRSWIGRKETRSEAVTSTVAERFNATFDRSGESAVGSVAPMLIHLCLALPAVSTSDLGPDGHPERGGFLPPVPLPRRMWAGGAFRFEATIRVGDMLTRHSEIADVVLKEGRSGTLCFVTIEHKFETNDRLAVTERHDIVYRGADASGGNSKSTTPAPKGQYRRVIHPSPVLLFRYSALTFNGHRIHYDGPYVRDVENYPGLIVHGPMQATMLVHFAESIYGKPPTRFDFRNLSPIFDDADFTINAAEDGDGLKLWTAYVDGPLAMEARAEW